MSLLNNMLSFLDTVTLKQGVKDKWRWRLAEDGMYTTKAVCEKLARRKNCDQLEEREEYKLLWNKLALLKVRLHAWRVI